MNEWGQTAIEKSGTAKQVLAILGASLLFIGAFLPIVNVPIVGSRNYFQNGQGDGTIVLILSVISIVLAVTRFFRGLWVTGLCTVGLLLFELAKFLDGMSGLSEQVKARSSDSNPLSKLASGLAEIAVNSVQLEWGWAVLMLGGVLIVAAAAIRNPESTPANGLPGQYAYATYPQQRNGPGWLIIGTIGAVLLASIVIVYDQERKNGSALAKIAKPFRPRYPPAIRPCAIRRVHPGMLIEDARAQLGGYGMDYRGTRQDEDVYWVDTGSCHAYIGVNSQDREVDSIDYGLGFDKTELRKKPAVKSESR